MNRIKRERKKKQKKKEEKQKHAVGVEFSRVNGLLNVFLSALAKSCLTCVLEIERRVAGASSNSGNLDKVIC